MDNFLYGLTWGMGFFTAPVVMIMVGVVLVSAMVYVADKF